MTCAAPATRSLPVHALKGGDRIAHVGDEVFDTAPHADARFTIVRVIDRRGKLLSLALLSDSNIEVEA